MNSIQMLIGGENVPAHSGKTFERRNPLDGQVATVAPAAGAQDARAAVDAAAAAFVAWSQTTPGERRALLMKAAHALESCAADFAAAMAAAKSAAHDSSACAAFMRRARRSPGVVWDQATNAAAAASTAARAS